MVTITVPDGYQYVGAALLSTVWLLFYQVRKVGKFRKSSGVKYPQLYAEKAEVEASIEAKKFNCAQRAHQGTLEFLPVLYPTALIAGLKFPHVAAAAIVLWTIGRASFTRGYTTGDPDKRVTTLYKLSYLGLFGLLFTSTYVAGEWVVAGICSASKLSMRTGSRSTNATSKTKYLSTTAQDMPKATSRPYLPTSLSEFHLPSSLSPGASSSALTLDDPPIIIQRWRRPSLLATRHHSPLASSFTLHSRRRSHSSSRAIADDFESDKERMSTESPTSSSENPTPPLKNPEATDDAEQDTKNTVLKLPSTPPRRRSSASMDTVDSYFQLQSSTRRLPSSLKQPRIVSLLAESRPDEIEVKSEAAFQRLISSFSDLPSQPRTPRSTADRGRYPEEAIDDDYREETPSDDDGPPTDTLLFSTPGGNESISISKTHTPSSSIHSINSEDLNSVSECSSLGNGFMDIDMHWPPSISAMSTPMSHWRRFTPPPSGSAVRSNKRKLDDRFDPYPSASKRRAVSPSLSHLREAHGSSLGSPISRNGNSRLPIAIPIAIPGSSTSSATSSPTIGSFASSYPRAMSSTSSPTLRATNLGLASPILRPVARGSVSVRRGDEEREVEGAGEAVNGMTLS